MPPNRPKNLKFIPKNQRKKGGLELSEKFSSFLGKVFPGIFFKNVKKLT